MNVYDFDDTIYDGDSTVDFYKFCLKKKPSIIFSFPFITAIGFLIGFVPKLKFKEKFYKFLTRFNDIDALLDEFWTTHIKNVKQWYYDRQKEDDVIISASPEFLLEPAMKKLGINSMMASLVDKHTGKYTGENCHGEEKVLRYRKVYGDTEIAEFYSDSLSDTPLAEISEKAYVITGENTVLWQEYKMPVIKKLIKSVFAPEFILFVIIGLINTLNTVWISAVAELVIPPNVAFIIGYIASLVIGYILNSKVNFKKKLSFVRLFKFAISYIPNFIIQNVIVFLTYNVLHIPSIISYAIAAILGIPITFLCVKLFAFAGKDK